MTLKGLLVIIMEKDSQIQAEAGMFQNIISIVRGGPAPEEQIPLLKKAGWDGVFFVWTGTDADLGIVKKIKDERLVLQSVHAPYERLDKLWESDKEGEEESRRLIHCIRDAASWGCSVVIMHAIIGMQRIAPDCKDKKRGLRNFQKIFDAAQEAGVVVAMENTEGEEYLDHVFSMFRGHPNVRFCIDTGHEMCYDYGHDLIGKYADLLFCTHLNDNIGMTGKAITWMDDLHLLPFDGVADWEKIASRLRSANYCGDFTYEVKLEGRVGRHEHDAYRAMSFKEYAQLAFERAKRFQKLFMMQ